MINTGDTAFVLLAAAMVLLMTPGLAFFYGGMVRRKNVLGVLMQCFIIMCVLFGYSLAFSPGNSFLGRFKRRADETVCGLCGNDTAPGVYDLSGNVCSNNSCSYYRCFCGKDEILCFPFVHDTLVLLSVRSDCAHGLGSGRLV